MRTMIYLVHQFDLQVLYFFIGLRNPVLTSIMIFFTRLGDEQVAYPAVLLVSVILWRWLSRRQAALFLVTLILSAISNTGLKEYFGRLRPDTIPLLTATDFSFPSGHAMNSIVFFGLLSYLLVSKLHTKWQRSLFVGVMILTSFLMGISRVYLGVHYLSDILVGYGLGAVFLYVAILLLKRLSWADTRKQV